MIIGIGRSNVNKYALIAIKAVVLARAEPIDPINAWKKVAA